MTKTQLYHSMKSEHLLDIIENGGWKKLSTHFLYSSFSDKEKYGKCVNGLCLSRDSNFVKNWNGDIVVVFDKGEIQKKYKIKPINWSFSNTYHNTKKAVKNGEFLYSQVKSKYVMTIGGHDILEENYTFELKKILLKIRQLNF